MSHELTIKQITFRNFLSYGNKTTTVNFDTVGTTLIVGEDLDNTTGGKASNGSGKTTIINALVYALYDNPLSKISKDNLINNVNKKNMEVTCTFEKNNKLYKIERYRKCKDGNYVKLFENGVDITRDSVANTNTLLESIIKIPYEIFIMTVVFSATKKPFLDLPSGEQTAIMEHLNGLTELSDRAERLKEISKDTQSELKQEEFKIDLLKKEQKRSQEQLTTAQQRIAQWDINKQTSIDNLKNDKKLLSQINCQQEIDNHTLIDSSTVIVKTYQTEYNTKLEKIKSYNNEKNKLINENKTLENHECPYCGQHYDDVQSKIKNNKETVVLLEEMLLTLITETDKLKQDIDDIQQEIKNIKHTMVTTSLKEATQIQSKVANIDRDIELTEKSVNPYIDSLNDLLNNNMEPISYDKINDLTKIIEHQKFLLKVLTKKDSFIRKVLLDKNLPFLNSKLHEYLTAIGLPHKVEFTSELTADISIYGKSLDFGNLSNGQCARVNIALSLAFRDLLQKLHGYVNVCLFDELLDVGMENIGVQAAAKLIKMKSKQEGTCTFIVSHREEVENMFDNIITVQMSNRFSTIKGTDENS